MSEDSNRCSACSGPIKQVGNFWCCGQCGHNVPVSQQNPSTPMRIFLSYGHDNNAELVERIYADLNRRGHDVWIDKSKIKFGDDWRREITDGIIGSNRVLSFLSKYSTREPGVCLDELAIAIGYKGANTQTVLVESETEVKAPPSIGHIQWLDMHDWKERRTTDQDAWESWYQGKLAEIVRVIESEQSRKFAGEIAALEECLKPISSDSRIAQLLKRPLVGRTWLFDAVEQWRNGEDRTSRLFWIMGAPGVGKSAFAAHFAHYGRDKVIAVQFIEYDKPDHRNPQRVVRTLAF
ncbi:MAG: TIR domain-containing protein, partial [Terriglobia bacterium]